MVLYFFAWRLHLFFEFYLIWQDFIFVNCFARWFEIAYQACRVMSLFMISLVDMDLTVYCIGQ
jgi:hypothetical protein